MFSSLKINLALYIILNSEYLIKYNHRKEIRIMEYVTIALAGLCLIVSLIILILYLKNKKAGDVNLSDNDLKKIRESINESVNNMTNPISSLIAEKNNSVMNDLNKKVDEINNKITELEKSQANLIQMQNKFKEDTINLLNENSNRTNKIINDFITQYTKDSNKQKEDIMNKLSSEIKEFNENVKKTLAEFDKSIKEKLEEFKLNTNESIKALNENVSKNLNEIREDNNKKLEKINESVNEKLQKTLEEKLKDSFKSVVEGIGDVNKAVGEIKGLATDVGSLKNVLTNVKTKGILGEVILGNIIREFLTAGQFEENVATKKNSTERVEFAIKLPGQKDGIIYLPVDSKFPYESYSIIHESRDIDEINEAKKTFRSNLLKYAKDVHDKYIDVPNTTDFAIIFLPLEGLYLEALNMGLFEEIQTKYKVNLTGPTTFTAFINSLNMGFRSLMIQKKSADVFKLLGAVKTEFGKFAEALEKTQNKVNAAADELDKLVGTRTKMMNSKLKDIDALDDETTKLLLENTPDD